MPAALPKLTSVPRPMPCRRDQSTRLTSIAPLCEMNETFPASGYPEANEALSLCEVLIIPRQFGPRIRIWNLCAILRIRKSNRLPLGPASAKPAEIMTTKGILFVPQSRKTFGTIAAGTAMTARSIEPATSRTDAYVFLPSTERSFGLIGIIRPRYFAFSMFRSIELPILFLSLEAPISAITFGANSLERFIQFLIYVHLVSAKCL